MRLGLPSLLTVFAAACGTRFPAHAPVAPAIVSGICAAAGGKGAHVQVWRRPEDASITTLEVEPPTRDQPTSYYDERGQEQLRVTPKSVGSGSPDALDDDRKRELVIEDGKRAERIPCDAPQRSSALAKAPYVPLASTLF